MGLFKDGKLVFMLERRNIEGRPAQEGDYVVADVERRTADSDQPSRDENVLIEVGAEGNFAELNEARQLIPSRSDLVPVEGAGHDLTRGGSDLPLAAIVDAFGRVRSG